VFLLPGALRLAGLDVSMATRGVLLRCCPTVVQKPASRIMSTLHIALQEGFEHDRVLVKVNGAEVANRPEVTTRNQIGFAEAVAIEVPDGQVQVEVLVPARNLSETIAVDVEGKSYVGASIEDGRLSLRAQREAFGYL
jgi:hypothetical protein